MTLFSTHARSSKESDGLLRPPSASCAAHEGGSGGSNDLGDGERRRPIQPCRGCRGSRGIRRPRSRADDRVRHVRQGVAAPWQDIGSASNNLLLGRSSLSRARVIVSGLSGEFRPLLTTLDLPDATSLQGTRAGTGSDRATTVWSTASMTALVSLKSLESDTEGKSTARLLGFLSPLQGAGSAHATRSPERTTVQYELQAQYPAREVLALLKHQLGGPVRDVGAEVADLLRRAHGTPMIQGWDPLSHRVQWRFTRIDPSSPHPAPYAAARRGLRQAEHASA
jgi:hypothetical protein